MVGISPKENRPSYFAFKYLLERGYRMIPVNPGTGRQRPILEQKVYATLSDIPEPVDMVDIFRFVRACLAHCRGGAERSSRSRRSSGCSSRCAMTRQRNLAEKTPASKLS